MEYRIFGMPWPALQIRLEPGQSVYAKPHSVLSYSGYVEFRLYFANFFARALKGQGGMLLKIFGEGEVALTPPRGIDSLVVIDVHDRALIRGRSHLAHWGDLTWRIKAGFLGQKIKFGEFWMSELVGDGKVAIIAPGAIQKMEGHAIVNNRHIVALVGNCSTKLTVPSWRLSMFGGQWWFVEVDGEECTTYVSTRSFYNLKTF